MPVWRFGTHFQNVECPADFVYPHNGEPITAEDIAVVYAQQLRDEAENPPPDRDEMIFHILSALEEFGYRGRDVPDKGRIMRKMYHPPDTPVRVTCDANPWKPWTKYWHIWNDVQPRTGDTLLTLKERGMARKMVFDIIYRFGYLEHAYDLKVSEQP